VSSRFSNSSRGKFSLLSFFNPSSISHEGPLFIDSRL
jgi:hypothetical protein